MTSFADAFRARTGGLPREFWWLWLGQFVNRLGTFVGPFLALYVTKGRGLSGTTASAVLFAWGVGLLPAPIVGGQLTDRIGRIPTLLLATVGGSLSLIALSLAARPATLIAAAVALGLFGESYRPAVSALMADIVPPADRPRAFGLKFWAINLGFAVATSIAGFLAEVSWSLLFVVDAATLLVFGLLVAWKVGEPSRVQQEQVRLFASFRIVLADRLFLGVLVLTTLYALLYSQALTTLGVQVIDSGLRESDFGTIIALNGVVIVLVQPLIINRVSQWRPGIALAIGSTVLGVGLGLTALASTWMAYAATVVVWTLGEILNATFAAPVVADISPEEMRGRYMGWFGFAFSVAFAVGPGVGLAVFGRWGGTPVWIGCTAIGLTVAAGWLILRDGIAVRRVEAMAAAV